MAKKKTPDPEKVPLLTPDQEYVHLCAQLGERQQLIMGLSAEIGVIYSQIQALKQRPTAGPVK